MYDCVLCCALGLYFSLSNTIHTDDKCFFDTIIDDYVSRTTDLLCVHFNHTITEQGSEFTVVPSLHPLHTILRGKERKYGCEILPVQKPHCLHRTCPTCGHRDVHAGRTVSPRTMYALSRMSSPEIQQIIVVCMNEDFPWLSWRSSL